MISVLTTIIAGILVFSFLVVIHELGHFLAAKKFGVPVHSFAIGFGPALYKKVVGETEYRINSVPLGGYVLMDGEDKSGVFSSMAVWKRMVVVAAGPLFNLITAVLVFSFVFATFGKLTDTTLVQTVVKDSPAYGVLQQGDELVKIDGKPIKTMQDVIGAVQASRGESIPIVVKRGENMKSVEIKPKRSEDNKRWQLGIQMAGMQDFRPPRANPVKALAMGVQETGNMMVQIFQFFGSLFAGDKEAMNNVGGPILIVQAAGYLAKTDLVKLVFFVAALSVNLGLINLLPFPALDGGRLTLMLVEAVRGKALDIEKEAVIHAIGFAVLIILMIVISVNDFSRVFHSGM